MSNAGMMQAPPPEPAPAAPTPMAAPTAPPDLLAAAQGAPAAAVDSAAPAAPVDPEAARAARVAEATRKAKAGAARHQARVQEQARAQQETQRYQSEAAQYRAQLEQASALQQQLRDPDPAKRVAAIKALGLGADDFYRVAAQDGTPEAKLAQLEHQLGLERQQRQAFEQRLAAERQAQSYAQVEQSFLAESRDATKYPAVSELAPHLVLGAAEHWVAKAKASPLYRGQNFTHAEILATLEAIQQLERKNRAANGGTHGSGSTSSGTNANGNPALPRTMGNAMATTSFSKAPDNWDDLSESEQTKYLVAELKKRRGAAKP